MIKRRDARHVIRQDPGAQWWKNRGAMIPSKVQLPVKPARITWLCFSNASSLSFARIGAVNKQIFWHVTRILRLSVRFGTLNRLSTLNSQTSWKQFGCRLSTNASTSFAVTAIFTEESLVDLRYQCYPTDTIQLVDKVLKIAHPSFREQKKFASNHIFELQTKFFILNTQMVSGRYPGSHPL